MQFQLVSDFKPTGDQPQAIEQLAQGILCNFNGQVAVFVHEGMGKGRNDDR